MSFDEPVEERAGVGEAEHGLVVLHIVAVKQRVDFMQLSNRPR